MRHEQPPVLLLDRVEQCVDRAADSVFEVRLFERVERFPALDVLEDELRVERQAAGRQRDFDNALLFSNDLFRECGSTMRVSLYTLRV